MKNKLLVIIIVSGLFFLSGCELEEETPEPEENLTTIIDTNKEDYSIILPFKSSPLRQSYASSFREIDMMEIGSRLQEKSKEYFDPKSYNLSEGSLINRSRYNNLLGNQTDENPNGLNLKPFEITDGNVEINNPRFVSDLVEINFHKDKDIDQVDGVAVALVLKRVQILDEKTGSTHKLSDETLYKVGQTLGLRLYSYLSTLEGMDDTPIFIGLYTQESDIDKLPGKYLPGYYIGHAFFESRSDQFQKDDEQWILLNENAAMDVVPEAAGGFNRFKNGVIDFASDENIGVVGRGFLIDDRLQNIHIEVTTGSKTYLELHGLAQYMSQELSLFDNYQVPITIDVRIYQKSKIVIEKNPGEASTIIELT